jgi:hypothetical protein
VAEWQKGRAKNEDDRRSSFFAEDFLPLINMPFAHPNVGH